MKPTTLMCQAALGLLSTVTCQAAFAIPLRWTVDTSCAQPVTFEAYQGETLELEAALQSYGKPLEAPSNYSLYWQTNGMGNAWWSAPCPVLSVPPRTDPAREGTSSAISNVLRAIWSPTNDVGAKAYTCFIGQPGTIYHAAFQLRLRPSPGAVPNELPLPQRLIDFAKVTVLNPPWITESADGEARPLPPYLHALDFADSYTNDAAWYYARPQDYGSCSSVRDGNVHARNYDWKFDDAAEFVVRMSASSNRFASVGVANCGTNLTERFVAAGKWSRFYKCLPGRTVDGINENGVVVNVNVVAGEPAWRTGGDIHPLAAVRWVLDNATSAGMAASNLAVRIAFPTGWAQNFHYMISDETATFIVENGSFYECSNRVALTNFPLLPTRESGEGQERYDALMGGASITSQWWTLTYTPSGYRASDLPGLDSNLLFRAWAETPRESHRGERLGNESWWQTVHTSVYDIPSRTLRVAVQETDDWYVFQVPSSGNGGVNPDEVREIVGPMVAEKRGVGDLAVYEHLEPGWHARDFPSGMTPLAGQPHYGPGVYGLVGWWWFDRNGNPWSGAGGADATNVVYEWWYDYSVKFNAVLTSGGFVPTGDRITTVSNVTGRLDGFRTEITNFEAHVEEIALLKVGKADQSVDGVLRVKNDYESPDSPRYYEGGKIVLEVTRDHVSGESGGSGSSLEMHSSEMDGGHIWIGSGDGNPATIELQSTIAPSPPSITLGGCSTAGGLVLRGSNPDGVTETIDEMIDRKIVGGSDKMTVNVQFADNYLDWVESDGTQTIDTGVILSNASGQDFTEFELEFLPLDQFYGGSRGLFGWKLSSTFGGVYGSNGGVFCGIVGSSNDSAHGYRGKASVEWIRCVCKDGWLRVLNAADGSPLDSAGNCEKEWSRSTEVTTDQTALIFGMSGVGAASYVPSAVRLRMLKIWKNGTLIRNFRPYSQNMVVGLMDDVHQVFYAPTSGNPLVGSPSLPQTVTVQDAMNQISTILSRIINNYNNK